MMGLDEVKGSPKINLLMVVVRRESTRVEHSSIVLFCRCFRLLYCDSGIIDSRVHGCGRQ